MTKGALAVLVVGLLSSAPAAAVDLSGLHASYDSEARTVYLFKSAPCEDLTTRTTYCLDRGLQWWSAKSAVDAQQLIDFAYSQDSYHTWIQVYGAQTQLGGTVDGYPVSVDSANCVNGSTSDWTAFRKWACSLCDPELHGTVSCCWDGSHAYDWFVCESIPCNNDGTIDEGEDCDDGNVTDGDGCTACLVDDCWDCAGDPSVCAPLAAGNSCEPDEEECTQDVCDGFGTCAHPNAASGTPCSPDEDQCTQDVCDGTGTCSHPDKEEGASCDDADFCTQTDTCQSGACVGTAPIVCCDGGICDPGTGTCSDCPAGFTPGGGGCQKTYLIDTDAELDNLPAVCGGDERYNDCSGSYGFHWTDEGDAGVGAVVQVDVQLESGLSCVGGTRNVTLNSNPIGSFSVDGTCSCSSPHSAQFLNMVDLGSYVKGGLNTVLTDDPGDCEGLTQDAEGNYAIVTVTYEAPPGTPVDCDDGQPCTQDSCQLSSGCVHAGIPLDPGSCLVGLKSKIQVKDSSKDGKDKLSW